DDEGYRAGRGFPAHVAQGDVFAHAGAYPPFPFDEDGVAGSAAASGAGEEHGLVGLVVDDDGERLKRLVVDGELPFRHDTDVVVEDSVRVVGEHAAVACRNGEGGPLDNGDRAASFPARSEEHTSEL